MVELLSPAGNMECLYAALSAGADAVYAGAKLYGARAFAGNFSEDELIDAIDLVHLLGKKLYLTLNILMKPSEMDALDEFLEPLYIAGLDGAIVQDLGVIRRLGQNFPALELHASTQMTLTGPFGAAYLKEIGCSRVVLSRELSIEEIRRIHESVDIELEGFVHGAMCYSYSGMCLMSSFLGGRSGNRGRCAGPCRQPYQPDKKSLYALSMKDMCALRFLPDIIEAGVTSLKIEGRMKPPRYVFEVTSIYRKYLDLCEKGPHEDFFISKADEARLSAQYLRGGMSTSYYKRRNGADMLTLGRGSYEKRQDDRAQDYPSAKEARQNIRIAAKGTVRLRAGENMSMSVFCGGAASHAQGDVVQRATDRPLDKAAVLRQMNKTGESNFFFDNIDIDLEDNVFVPLGQINALRRECLGKLKERLLEPFRRGGI